MDFRHQIASAGALSGVAADALVVVIHGDSLDASLDPAVASHVKDAVSLGDFQFKAGKTVYVQKPIGLKAQRLVVAAAGGPTVKAFKSAVASGLALVKGLGVKHVAVVNGSGDVTEQHAEAVALAAADAAYLYRDTKPSAQPAPALAKLTLLCGKVEAKDIQRGLVRGAAIAEGVTFAKVLANLPGNRCTPTYLGEQAKQLGKEHGLKVEVLDKKQIEKLGMGSFLAVAQGSAQPPRFIVARYDGAAKTQAPIVLVGKGITFDTGGISIKPSAEMDEMKYDMGGAASVLGTLRAIAELKPKLNLVVLVPTCENMPSSTAVKPGDVVTSLSGQTIEILNTDAEGRLILCDALTYAERFNPACVVDVATLTGACVIALGNHNSGLFSPDDALAEQLLKASKSAIDPLWRLPLDEEYDEALKSNFADMANVGSRAGGAITAAKFLQRYTGKYRWAHVDIAGTAWKSGAAKGATGRPVGLLTHFVLSQAA
ncbi:leucyl aminopeptidase [Piscinibacter terrae]|uniref:Probable cytosol aminopeptidase n=1 Tax=Piscinibacter terrae TaxID=2496871 RepID=A0A3N7HKS8_9BURK|nr:leucyl aminopeptidase [Albitalea terrae]RQP22143.1 leucyl aminopeptidase [Albitalea terrae]